MKPLFTGTGTALITPFKNGEIDWDALDNLVESQIAGGVSALIAAGTTGEPATMTWDEHIEVIRFVAERAKDRACVIAGTGSNCTREVIHAANVVKDFGVAAPIVVYNVPSRTGVNIQPATLEKICRLPQVVAVKEANPDVAQAMEKINLVGDNATFYCGNDDLTIPLMVLGFQGVISVLSNVMPAETSKMTSLALSGNWAEASKMQRDLLPMVKALFCETSPIPCKAAMSMMGMCRNELRLPLIPMQEANQQKLADIMRGWKLI